LFSHLLLKNDTNKKQFVENYYYAVKWFGHSVTVNPYESLPNGLVFLYRLSIVVLHGQAINVLIELIGTIIVQHALTRIIVHQTKLSDVFCEHEKISNRKVLWANMERLRFIVK
jgi:hypothetical protein